MNPQHKFHQEQGCICQQNMQFQHEAVFQEYMGLHFLS